MGHDPGCGQMWITGQNHKTGKKTVCHYQNGLSDIRCIKHEAALFEGKEFVKVNMPDTVLLMLHFQKRSMGSS